MALDIPSVGPPRPLEFTKFMTESSMEMPSFFSMKTGTVTAEHKSNNQGALAGSLNAAAGRGKILTALISKPEVPDTSGMGAFGGGAMKIKEEFIMVYDNAAGAVETGVVFASITSHSEMGGIFNMSTKVEVQDETAAVITKYASEGWRLSGTRVLLSQATGQATAFSGTTANSSMMTELVFQRLAGQPPCEIAQYQVAIEMTMKSAVGAMPTTVIKVPDFETFLNQLGQEGWELSSVASQPAGAQTNMQGGMMSSEVHTKLPVHVVLHRVNQERKQFKTQKYNYDMKMPGMGSMQMTIDGDHVPMIKDYAEKGWTVKGAIQLPTETGGSPFKPEMTMPFLYFFQA